MTGPRWVNAAYARACRKRARLTTNLELAVKYDREAAQVETILNQPPQPRMDVDGRGEPVNIDLLLAEPVQLDLFEDA